MPRGDVQANSQFMIPTLQELLPDNLALAPLPVRVYSIAQAIHALMPDRFYLLEGFSREEGGVIFFSRDSRKIYNSGTGLHALPLGDSGWFVNTAISQNEAPEPWFCPFRSSCTSYHLSRLMIPRKGLIL